MRPAMAARIRLVVDETTTFGPQAGGTATFRPQAANITDHQQGAER
jgi:hypothetical protein